MSSLPAAFIGHGSPMNTLETNRYTTAWREFGASIDRPRAIVCISAHWYVHATVVTAMQAPRTIHDFYGFPQELFDVDYPAPGSPAVAQDVVDALAPTWCGLDTDSWGLDHGTWSVLAHLWPSADVPVLQLSLDAQKPIEEHIEIGRALEPLRHEGILLLGSGNVVHNLSLIDWSNTDGGADWAHVFDNATRSVMTSEPAQLGSVLELPEAQPAVPTPDHFLPLAYIAGIADAADTPARTLIDGYAYGSLSMTSYVVD
ncbi:MAG: 4,5-DOPA dioxygenase extradiol [Actinomycetes bacterium]